MEPSTVHEEARRLVDEERYAEALSLWEGLLGDGGERRLLLRMAAVAWHRLNDAARARSYLDRLQQRDRESREARLLLDSMVHGALERIRTLIRLGVRRGAFISLAQLREDPSLNDAFRGLIDDMHVEYLCAPWTKLMREQLRRNESLMLRLKEKDSPVWKVLRTARNTMDGEDVGERRIDVDDPELHSRIQRETALVRLFLGKTEEYDRRLVHCAPDEFIAVLEDVDGVLEFEAILHRVGKVATSFASYAATAHVEAKDFLGSFLPASLRDRVCNESYLRLARLEAALEHDVDSFCRRRYPVSAGGSAT